MTVFVDTSALYAVLDRSDSAHGAAAGCWEDLLRDNADLLTSNYVIVETLALLQNRIGTHAVRLFVADVLPVLNVSWIDEGSHRIAVHGLLVSGRRQLSLVDCVSFHVMREYGTDTAFCFDNDFAEQGFRVLPSA